MKKVLIILFTVILLPSIAFLFSINFSFTGYEYYTFLINQQYGIVILEDGPKMGLIDEVNSIPKRNLDKFDKQTFRFYAREARTAGDIEIYKAEDKDSIILLEFNPGDGCYSFFFDNVEPNRFKLENGIFTDGNKIFEIRNCEVVQID